MAEEDKEQKQNPEEVQAPNPANPLANLDEETQKKIQEIQAIEGNFQQIMMQKQTFTFELNETDLALEELAKSEGEVFKLVGNQIVIKSTKEKLDEELKHKKELIETRLKNIEKQEKDFETKVTDLRQEIMKKIS
jgi:prefoldin beta subunit